MRQLSGRQIEEVQAALLDAFPSKDELRIMVRVHLDAHLETIADGPNQRVAIFNLVTWAERTGRMDDLVQGALRYSPGNPALQQLRATWPAAQLDDAKPEPTVSDLPAGDGQRQTLAPEGRGLNHTPTLLTSLAGLAVRLLSRAPNVTRSGQGRISSSDNSLIPDSLEQSQLPSKGYRQLVGRGRLLDEAMSALRDPHGRSILAVDGMGGIGKTAFARELVTRCIEEHLFTAIAWESVPKTEFSQESGIGVAGLTTFDTILDAIGRQLGIATALNGSKEERQERLRAVLRNQHILLVLDNLETANESQSAIASKLQHYLNPSKAILTSRTRFTGEVYVINVPGLDEPGALALIRQDAGEKGIRRIEEAKLGELERIADATGGSPLALKLVVGQLGHLPLEAVLSQLRDVKLPLGANDESDYYRFYRFIFSPSWQLLSHQGKELLIAMAHFSPGLGGTLDAVRTTSHINDTELVRCIDELWRLSFLEVGGSIGLEEVRYYLHALTQYFVLSDIVRAPFTPNDPAD